MGLAGYGSLGQHVSVSDRLNTLNLRLFPFKLQYCISSFRYCVCSLESSLNSRWRNIYVVFSGQG